MNKSITKFAIISASLGLVAFGGYAIAQTSTEAAKGSVENLRAQPSGEYNLDGRHANVIWTLTHMGVSRYSGRFDTIAGTLNLDSQDPTKSSIEVTIDAKSVSTPLPNFNTEIATQAFGAEQFPTITFKSTSLSATSATHGTITGDLTFHGQTKPVTFDVSFVGGGTNPFSHKAAIGFHATGKIKRSDFGVSNWIPFASDEVDLTIDAEFGKK